MNKREIKLKAIKPGMIIHCKNDEEKKALLEEADRLGYKWNTGLVTTDCRMFKTVGMTIHFYDKNNSCDFLHIAWSDKTDGVTEFSDLILPELTAEEVLHICTEICFNKHCEECPMKGGNCFRSHDSDKEEIVKICQQWKSDHEKKEPEIETEWFWRGKIFSIDDMGRYLQIADDKSVFNTGCECQESAEEYMANELKEYCKTHEGNYIAKVERICRVKAVE